jgi:hypothetical protein
MRLPSPLPIAVPPRDVTRQHRRPRGGEPARVVHPSAAAVPEAAGDAGGVSGSIEFNEKGLRNAQALFLRRVVSWPRPPA